MKILIADDDPQIVRALRITLGAKGHQVVTAGDGPQAIAAAIDHRPDLVLLDLGMPRLEGVAVIHALRGWSQAPILVVSGRAGAADKVEALDAGADDYLTKPINFPELEARVRSMLRIKRLQDELDEKNRELGDANRELEHANRRLRKLSITDGLTGLFNHRHIHELLHEEFERSRRSGEPLAVAMMDLDHFKQVNDTYGHPTGDVILYETAQILRDTSREIDMLGRYGGEEFMAILPGTDEAAAARFGERVRERVEEYVFRDEAVEVRMTTSYGVASFPGPGLSAPDDLVKLADEALYAAKAGGRNRVVRASTLTAGE